MSSNCGETLNNLKKLPDADMRHLCTRLREGKPVAPPKEFTGEQIKRLRERNNFTQAYLGDIIGVSLKTIQMWETGTNKPPGAALRLFQILEDAPHILEQFIMV